MTRALLFLLALLQQFMPPGMCLCQGLLARTAPEQTRPVAVEQESAGCPCCKKKPPQTEAPIERPAAPSAPCCPNVHADADEGILAADPVEYCAVEAVAVDVLAASPPTQANFPARSRTGSPPLDDTPRHLRI